LSVDPLLITEPYRNIDRVSFFSNDSERVRVVKVSEETPTEHLAL
jgi:hypothetical protein